MAKVGMKYCVCAPIVSEQYGQPITYGTGVVMGNAISAEITYNRTSNSLYGNDVEIEVDNSIVSADVNFTVDQVSMEGKRVAFGMVIEEEEGGVAYDITGESSPYIGQGYIAVMIQNGKYMYCAKWIHKLQYGPQGDRSATKGENITWQTESVTGKAMAVYIDNSGKSKFVREFVTDNEATAMEWLRKKANIIA